MSSVVYAIITPGLMAFLCFVLVAVYAYLSHKNGLKRLPKAAKGFNWFLLGTVYLMDWLLHPEAVEIRVYFRLVFFLLVVGELAYHGDLTKKIDDLIGRGKRE